VVRLTMEYDRARVRSVSGDKLGRLLADASCLLLDFDGPVCGIFATYQAPAIAAELRRMLPNDLPESVRETSDPLEILRWAGTNAAAAGLYAIEDSLRAAELQAAAGAMPTEYAREVMTAAELGRRQVAIVSNNSAPAIRSYLISQGLDKYVSVVVGRKRYQPELMKPSPYSVLAALERLGAKPSRALLIGDSLTDITAANNARVQVIGLANEPGKQEIFLAADADAVVTSMADIATAITHSWG
jgi:HAD superfamily hydrolase (TIGR01509 family)